MNHERRQVLEMLAEGKITADDAERLLDKLGRSDEQAETAADSTGAPTGPGPGSASPGSARAKYLRLVVDSDGGDRVNIRVPLSLIRAGIKLRAVMPQRARERLEARGIDLGRLNSLDGDELVQALRELHIDVDSANGEKVRIFCCE